MGYVEMTRGGEVVVLKAFDQARRFLMEQDGWQAVDEFALPGDVDVDAIAAEVAGADFETLDEGDNAGEE